MGVARPYRASRMSASSDLVWQIVRKNNSFLVKRNMLELSSEPNNLMNKNSFKYSGIANTEAVGIEDEGKGVTFTKKNPKRQRQPARNLVSVELKKDFRKVAKTIKDATEGSFYRKDLTKPALARWYKIWKSQQNAAAISKA